MPIVEELQKKLSYGESFDISFRKINVKNHLYQLFFLNFLTNSSAIVKIIYFLENEKFNNQELASLVYNESVKIETNLDLIYEHILNGDLALFVDDEKQAIICEVKNYPTRSISEPDSERVVRGSRDGFCENMAVNLGLIRRRIKSGKLKIIKYTIGKISKTSVALIYLDDYVNEKYLQEVKNRLDKVDVAELTMSDKALEELIINNKITPYPLVKYTERPDTFVAHLYQGMFGIMVDTSPSAMLGPICLFDHMQHAEEFRQTLIAGSYLRFIRFLGIIVSFLVVPIWYTLLKYQFFKSDYFGTMFAVNDSTLAIFIQLLLMELVIEFIRMASIHTPNALSTSMGIVAGVIVGQMAIDMKIISEQIVLLGAISAIGSYITPSYELSLANKIAKLILILVVFLFGIYGLILGILGLIIYLAALKSFGRPYLYPLIPLNGKALLQQIFRKPYH